MRTVSSIMAVLLLAAPARAAGDGPLLRFERAAERVWGAVKRATPRDTELVQYGYKAQNKAVVDGAMFRAGYYGSGKQLQIELPGENGMSVSKVINFGPDATLRNASVVRRWSDGSMLQTIKSPGSAPVYFFNPPGRRGEKVSAMTARTIIRGQGRFRPLRTPAIQQMQQAIQRDIRGR